MRKIDERLSHAANIVYDSNSIISSFTKYISVSEMMVIVSPLLPNLVCYFDNFEELTGYPDYLGEFFKLRENNRIADCSWEHIPFPTRSYLNMVSAYADKDIIPCPITTTTTIATPTTSTIPSSISVTGSETPMNLHAAMRQLQLLQSNQSLMNTMDDTVRKLVLSLGVPRPSTQIEEESIVESVNVPSEPIPLPPSTSREVDRRAYLEAKNRRAYQEKESQKDLLKATSSSSQANKRKTICLGFETQRSLPNPDNRIRLSTASSKTSSIKTVADKMAKNPSDDKLTADMHRGETIPAFTTATDSPTAPPRH